MDVFRPDQVLTVVLFLALLGGLWLWVRLNRDRLARGGTSLRAGSPDAGAARLPWRLPVRLPARLSAGLQGRMRVAEVTALSPVDRAVILQVDGREFLVVQCRGAAPSVTPLPPAPADGGA